MCSVISVIVDSLPGNNKKQGIDKFVAFGVRLVHSWAGSIFLSNAGEVSFCGY